MDKGIYTATSGGLHYTRKLDVTANNIANVNTVGYKAERLLSREQEFTDTLIGSLPQQNAGKTAQLQQQFEQTPGVVSIGTSTDFSPGPVQQTGNPLNVAIGQKNSFFVVSTPQGDAYTRAGNFSINSEGSLVTPDGFAVQGDGGPLTLPPGAPSIAENGLVLVDGQEVGKLKLVEFANPETLLRSDGTRFTAGPGTTPTDSTSDLIPASLEMPNVNMMSGMIELVNTQRAFEAYSKTVKTVDELNDRSIRNARGG